MSNIEIPRRIHETLEKLEWRQDIDDEIRALKKNETWELSDLPKRKQLIGYKWIFTVKYK